MSKGGTITLIKSTLSNLPTYFLSLLPILASVAFRIEKFHQDFLWSGMGDDFKFYLVKLDIVFSQISYRGLDIINLKIFNKALLEKCLWRYNMKLKAL